MGQLELEVGFVCMGKVGHREVVERILEKPELSLILTTVTYNYFYTAEIKLSNKGKIGFFLIFFMDVADVYDDNYEQKQIRSRRRRRSRVMI